MPDETANVRYMVDDVTAAIDFYTSHLGFTVLTSMPPAFADVARGHLRLLLSGPLGGDAQISAMIAGGELDMVVFLWDPLVTHAHAPDVQSLIRLAVVHNVAIACNRRSADLMMSSRLLDATAV